MSDDAAIDWGAWDAPLTEQVRLPSTGRPAELHTSLRVSDIVRRGLWTPAIEEWFRAQIGEATIAPDRAVEARDRVVVCAVVRPRLCLTEEEAAETGAVPVSRLTDDEIDDIVTHALGGRAFMEAFRGAAADAASGRAADGGAPVDAAARKPARPARRRGGAAPARAGRGAQ